jgi:hypothetical protein
MGHAGREGEGEGGGGGGRGLPAAICRAEEGKQQHCCFAGNCKGCYSREAACEQAHPSHTPKESSSSGIAATMQAMYRMFERGFGPGVVWRGHTHGVWRRAEDAPQHNGCMRTRQLAAQFRRALQI